MKMLIELFDVITIVFYSVCFYLLKFLVPGIILYYVIRSSTKKQIKAELEKYDLKLKEEDGENKESVHK